MTNSWQQQGRAESLFAQLHFDFSPSSSAKVLLALPSFGSTSSLSADSRGAPPTSSGATSRDRLEARIAFTATVITADCSQPDKADK